MKIYDFQLYFYGSFAHDLVFFLLSSVKNNDLKMNIVLFIDYYMFEFKKTMEYLKMPLDDYTDEK